jgi:hypothetical protein
LSKLTIAVNNTPLLLVGDNAFQGVSHLSQNRARDRRDEITNPDYCADLVITSIDNGADGFMFSANSNTLSILKSIKRKKTQPIHLYAIVPSAVDYVRLSGQMGMENLAKEFSKQMITSRNISAMFACLTGLAKRDITSLLRGLLSLEIGAIKSAAGKQASLDSVLMHELLTDMGLALNLKWLFKEYIDAIVSHHARPGFETRNFSLFVQRFNEWQINSQEVLIVAPFNSVGFQMNPSKEECEKALYTLQTANVLAINILASGFLSIEDSSHYIRGLPNVQGVAVGVSKKAHACETFMLLKKQLQSFANY